MMARPSLIRRAWRLLLRRSDVHRAVEEEIALHLELTAEEHMAQGMDPGNARREAERLFGDRTAYQQACEEVGQRRRRKRQLLHGLGEQAGDIRLTLRSLRRTPLFTILAVLVIAVGIGAVTTMYTLVKSILLEALPYPGSERIVRLTVATSFWGTSLSLSEPEYVALRDEASTLQDVTIVVSRTRLLQSEDPRYVRTAQAGWQFFPMLGVAPSQGRVFTESDDRPDADRVAVLSHAFWSEEYPGDETILGRTVVIDGTPYTVIGIMPDGFSFPSPDVAVWVPYRIDPANLNTWNNHSYWVYARLRDGANFEEARTEIATMGEGFVRDHPEIYAQWQFRLGIRPLIEDVVGRVRTTLLFLLGATGLFLLIAALNVANLLTARGEARGRELAIRTALGASRRRITVLLLIEAGVLACAGGILGFLLAVLGVRGVARAAAEVLPRISEVSIDPGVLLFAVVVTSVTALIFGLLPVFRAGRFDVQTQLRETGRALTGRRSGTRLRRGLITAEVALSVVLVTGAIMMMRSLQNLRHFDLGYQTEDRLTMQVILPWFQNREETVIQQFYAELLDRIRSLPGVEQAGAIEYLPLTTSLGTWSIRVEGEGTTSIGDAPGSYFLETTPEFFATMGIEMVTGRAFTRHDIASSQPVVIVNEAFARQHWPGGRAVGRRIALFDSEKPWLEVVGVVRDVRHESVLEEPYQCMYIPLAQASVAAYETRWWMSLVIHGTGVAVLTGPIRQIVWEMDPAAVINNVRMMKEVHRAALADRTLPVSLLSFFSTLALVLAAAGVYALVAYLAVARTAEYGLHIALGACPSDIRRLVMREGLVPVLAGVGGGIVTVYLLSGLGRQFLFGVSRLDPTSYLLVVGLLVATALVAGFQPAVRSSRVDPVQVLNRE